MTVEEFPLKPYCNSEVLKKELCKLISFTKQGIMQDNHFSQNEIMEANQFYQKEIMRTNQFYQKGILQGVLLMSMLSIMSLQRSIFVPAL